MWMFDDVGFEQSDRIIHPAPNQQTLGEIVGRGCPDLGEPDCLSHRPCLIAKLFQRRSHPSIQRVRQSYRIAAAHLNLGAGDRCVHGDIESISSDSGAHQIITNATTEPGHRGSQCAPADIQQLAEPLGANWIRGVYRERAEQASLAGAGDLDDHRAFAFIIGAQDLNRTENSNGGFSRWHPTSVAQAAGVFSR